MSVFEYVIFSIALITFFPFFISFFIYVPFYVHILKKYDTKNSTEFNLEDWWRPISCLGVIWYFYKRDYKKLGNKWLDFNGNILTYSLGYSGILFFCSILIIIIYLLLVGPTYQ